MYLIMITTKLNNRTSIIIFQNFDNIEQSQMKTILQLNLDSPFNKNYYRIRKNKLQITKDTPHTQYSFDNLCYSAQDCNSSIIYDIVIDYSSKNKIMANTQSTASINISDHQNHNPQTNTQTLTNFSTTIIADQIKQPQYNYTVIFDQITQNQSIQALIKQLSCTEIFKKQNIMVGHFLAHDNGVFDFHKKRMHLTDTERQELDKEFQKLHGSIQDNFMWVYNKQVSLCQQIKHSNIPHLTKSLTYISAEEFNKLNHPVLGVQLASNMTKAEQIQHKQLQNKKILQIFVVNIGLKIRVVLILFNYNKNYSLSLQQQRELSQLMMMHGVVTGDIKYQTTKIEILNKIMKNNERLYYTMYFPGPRLSSGLPLPQPGNIMTRTKTQQLTSLSPSSHAIRDRQKTQTLPKFGDSAASSFTQLKSSKVSQFSRGNSPQKLPPKPNDFVSGLFINYTALNTKDRDSIQRVIKEYLIKKQDNLKVDLQRGKERIKQLKLNQRIEESQVLELKNKCTKALQKMSQSIIQLRKMGINNVQRHIDWLKFSVDQKKQQIKEAQQEIQQINKKTIENRKSHSYFYSKMIQFRDKLKKKQMQILKSDITISTPKQDTAQDNKQSTHQHTNYLTELSLAQLQQLQQHKDKLKAKLVQKLKNSSEKKIFYQSLAEIKGKVSKLELTRLEQKYFDLLHD